MSRIKLTIALSIAVALIGGATWSRFFQTTPQEAYLVSVPEIEQLSSEEEFLEDFVDTGASLSTGPAAPLSETDLVGRQLFSDYIELASMGQTSSENLNTLATKYANNILNGPSVGRIEINQIIIVPNSEENLSRYSQSITFIRNKYKNLAEGQYRTSEISDVNSPAFKTFMSAAGKLYRASANELLGVQTPISLAEDHRALINNYLGSALAMEALANISNDPVSAYAALNTQAKNTKEETDLLLKIQMAMIANGIIWYNF